MTGFLIFCIVFVTIWAVHNYHRWQYWANEWQKLYDERTTEEKRARK